MGWMIKVQFPMGAAIYHLAIASRPAMDFAHHLTQWFDTLE
jgi:hypothetical protein